MFAEKLTIGAGVGGGIGLVAAIAHIFDSQPLAESLKAIPAGIFLGLLFALWWWWRSDEGDDFGDSCEPDIRQLQNQLRAALENAAYNERQGDLARAGYWRSQAAVIESQLRSVGA